LGGVQVQPALNLTLSGFNILGNLGRVLGEVVLYRIEARRSQARLRELQLRVGVVSRIIDAHTRSELIELDLRARALDGALSLAGAERGGGISGWSGHFRPPALGSRFGHRLGAS
jgi:hypothetical protein